MTPEEAAILERFRGKMTSIAPVDRAREALVELDGLIEELHEAVEAGNQQAIADGLATVAAIAKLAAAAG